MKTRHLGMTLVALVATVSALGINGMPASGNDVVLTAGILSLYGADSTLVHSLDLDETTADKCPGSNNDSTMSMSTTHAWTFNNRAHVTTTIAGTHFTVVRTISSNGNSSTTGTSTGTASAIFTLTPNSSNGCGVVQGSDCIIIVTQLVLNGVHNMNSGISASDSVAISGDNGNHGDFGYEVSVSGNCGALSVLDDGSATLNTGVLHATT